MRATAQRMHNRLWPYVGGGALLFGLALLLQAGCGRRTELAVGSKNFTEQVVLGEIIAQHLEARLSQRVIRNLNLGGTLLAHQALLSGDIDLYPEYTGTALTAVLKAPLTRKEPGAVRREVDRAYREKFQLEWLPPLGFNNSFAMLIRAEEAARGQIRTLSDAAQRKQGWRLGVGYEFEGRPDGLPALRAAYNLTVRGAPTNMDLGLLYQALAGKQVDMIAANSTDGLISRGGVTLLADDKRAFPPYEASIVVRLQVLAERPRLREILRELSGKLNEETMRRLNYEVDGNKAAVESVARSFLQQVN